VIARALWLRPLRRNPTRAVATVVGVATGVASVVATLMASRAAVASLADGVDVIAGEARLEIYAEGGVDPALLGELRDLAGDVLFAPVIEETAICPALDDLVRVLGVDLLIDGGVRDLALETGSVDGSLETLLTESAVALPRPLAERLGVTLGDRLELLVRTRRVELEVAGLFDAGRFASIWDRVLVVDVALAQELYGRPGRVDRYELKPRHPQDLDVLRARIAARMPAGHRVAPPSERRVQTEGMLRSLEFNLTALSGISILVGAVLVATTLATSVVQRRKMIALLRSLGASRAQIARAVLFEAAAIGLVGGALGVLGGWAGAGAAVAGVRATVASIVREALPGAVRLEPAWVALGLLLGLGTSLAAAVLPLREATSTPPIQGLTAERPESVAGRRWSGRALTLIALLLAAAVFAALPPVGDRPLWALASSMSIMAALLVVAAPLVDLLSSRRLPLTSGLAATPLRVAQAALEAGRTRAAWAAGAVAIAVALAVSMTAMIGSFRSTVVEWSQQAMRSDVYLRPIATGSGVPAGRLDPQVARVATSLFGAHAVDPFHSAQVRVEGELVELGGAAYESVAQVGGVPFVDGRPSREVFSEAAEHGGALVNEPFARRFEVERGDTLELETPSGVIAREVTGVFRDYSNHRGLVVIARDDFLAHYPDEGPSSIGIFLPEGADAAAARTELLDALGGLFALDALLNGELQREVLEVFDRTFAVTVALQMIAAAVAVIAVLTVLFALVGERRRELAIVRVLGGSRRQVVAVVLAQAGLLGAAGAIGGLAAGLVVGWILVKIVNLQSFGWTLSFLPPWGSLALTVAAVLPAALLAGLAPALAALRAAPQEVLHEDG
jgi:putative ABC transport system permease protein